MKRVNCVRASRTSRLAHILTAALLAAALAFPAEAHAQAVQPQVLSAIQDRADRDRDVEAFYRTRSYRPLWIEGDRLGPAARALVGVAETADLDGLNPRQFRPGRLRSAIDRAETGDPEDLARAEVLLCEGLANLVKAMRQPKLAAMHYASEALAPAVPTTEAALDAAARAPSLEEYVRNIGWMHPIYGQLRGALEDPALSDEQRQQVRINLERARAIPAYPADRYVLVDAAAARLYMYEDGQARGTMKVVVGKTDNQTPMMAGFIRYAILNPYWNVPPDLVKTKIAANVLAHGIRYLKANGYQLLSDWTDTAEVIDPSTVDWKAVASGDTELRVRQLPGKNNFMGTVKFMFPNELGIYLHDTPEKNLMLESSRQYSSGCVRLEDAQALGRWLFNQPLVPKSRTPEQQAELPDPVPVYITYLTVAPEAGKIAFRPDVYGRDGAQLAQLNGELQGTR